MICAVAFGSPRQITVRVTDARNGVAIHGASVMVQSASNVSGITDRDGALGIGLDSPEAKITVSYPGYGTQVVYAGKNDEIHVALTESDLPSMLEEINLPMGPTRENEVTSSVSRLVVSKAEMAGASSIEELLQGRVQGMNVKSNSGMPGQGGDITVRGHNSMLATQRPLVIIDGVMTENATADGSSISGYYDNPLKYLDINDVEQITVLRSGTAIYGAKGTGGVIIIDTQRPQDAKTTVQAAANWGAAIVPKAIPMLSGSEHRQFLFGQMQQAGLSVDDITSKFPWMAGDPSYPFSARYNNNTLWQDEVMRTGFKQDYHLMVKGGDAIAKYVFSVGYLNHSSTLKSAQYERYNARLNADLMIAKRLNLLTNISYTVANTDAAEDMRALKTSLLGTSLVKSPLFHPSVIDNNGIVYPRSEDVDPLGIANPAVIRGNVENQITGNDFKGSVKAVLDINKYLDLSSLVSVNYYKTRENRFIPFSGTGGFDEGDRMSGRFINEYLGVFNDTRLTWNRTFDVLHNVNLVAGFRVSANSKQQDDNRDFGLANDEFKTSSTEAAATSNIDRKFVSGAVNQWNWMDYYLQVGYSYRDLLYLDAGAAAEASSKFAAAQRWQYFPFVSGAVRLTSIEGLRGADWLSELKLRTGWEMTGNDDIGCYTARGYYAPVMYRGFSGLVKMNYGNPALKNESTSQANIGLDAVFLSNRLRFSVDYYNAVTKDLLTATVSAAGDGDIISYANAGRIATSGWEIAVDSRIVDGTFKWDLGANISFPRAVVQEMPSAAGISYPAGGRTAYIAGEAPGVFYGYVFEGVYSTSQLAAAAGMSDANGTPFAAGDAIYAETVKDGVLDSGDYAVIGNPLPEFFGGIHTKFAYKRVSLSAMVDFTYGNDVFNYQRMVLESMNGYYNQTTAVKGRWMQEGQITDIPRAVYGQHENHAFSSRWIEDGSYIKLRNVTLAYDIPTGKLRSAINVYVSANNLFTATRYLGYDPEVGLSGIDYGNIPVSRNVMVGLKVRF